MQKPHRFLMSRVASYAEEGSAFLRRRRIRSQPFVRIWREGGAVESLDADSEAGAKLSAVAEAMLATETAED
jgi:hypothetical protein